MSILGALSVALGLRDEYRCYKTYPSFERGHSGPWEPHPWFGNVERRSILVTLDCCPHDYWQYRRKGSKIIEYLKVPEPLATFDWLRDYGPYWEPGSTAFWLAPETPEQLSAWRAAYEAPRVRDYIDVRAKPNPHMNPYMNQLAALQQGQGYYANQLQNQQQQYSAGYNSIFCGIFGRL